MGALSRLRGLDAIASLKKALNDVASNVRIAAVEALMRLGGPEALAMLEHARPSLVLLDMRMPVLDGWQFAHALKQRGVQLPILVMTAAQDARRWAQEIGAQGYISKPFELTDLLAAVERFAVQ